MGSNTFGTKEKYDWLLHPITLRIYNADHEADYANGFEPDVKIEELVIGNDLLPFGDTNERLLSEALSRISGLKSLPVHAESEGRIFAHPVISRKKTNERSYLRGGKIRPLVPSIIEGLRQLGFIFDILTKIFFSSDKSSYFILIFVSGIN